METEIVNDSQNTDIEYMFASPQAKITKEYPEKMNVNDVNV